MAAILPLPTRSRPDSAAPEPAQRRVHAFPLDRDYRMVEGIADEMRSKPTETAAEVVLTDHLELMADWLERRGVHEDEILRECRSFAVAVWKLVLRRDRNVEGIA